MGDPSTGRPPGRSEHPTAHHAPWLTIALPALIAYVPLLLTQAGQVGADTKTYLYLDPSRLLAGAPTMWDAETGMGTVSHQNIGYLFPMGPFYWLAEQVGSPDWVAQRLWLGTVLFLAAMGVRYLLRTVAEVPSQFSQGAVLAASLAYMLSPYVLDYSARISVILLPWVALPWLIALAHRAVRTGGWRAPALFALVALAAGGINATALILMSVGPLLWFAYEWRIERVADGRTVLGAVWRCGVLTLLTSLWWMAGLWAQGGYGLPVLRYTESYRTVAEASSAAEVLRGLGYWYFYGEDKLGQWIEPSEEFTTRLPLLALSFAIPLLALAAATLVRWRHRAYFLLLLVVGTLGAVASHPWEPASALGGVFKAATRTDAGLALRSTPRAVPLVVLATAVLLGAGVHALGRRWPARAGLVAALACLVVLVNMPPMWNGTMVADNLKRPEDLPQHWLDAIEDLDAAGTATRILEVPGADFASYRWGNTVDPITPGLTDRPYVARELFQYGTAAGANLLIALDEGFHDRTADPEALATVAALMGVGDVVVRSDLQYERYRIGRPDQVWDLVTSAPGLDEPVRYGEGIDNLPEASQPLVDEITLGDDEPGSPPPAVAVFSLSDPRTIVRAVTAERPLLIAGDGEGLVGAAGAGLVDVDQAIFYSASFADDAEGFERVYGAGADLLVTDTNRARGRRWGGLRENAGYTEQADEEPLTYDPTDNRLEVFEGADSSHETVTVQDGVVRAVATSYGNPVTFTPDERAAGAIDGDPLTAWRTAAIGDPVGERLVLDFDQPVDADRIGLLQPQNLTRNRWITEVRLHFDDGGPPVDATIGLDSQVLPGEEVQFGPRRFEHLEIEILDTDVGRRARYDGLTSVGFAEVSIPGVPPTTEVVRPPTDLLDAAGASSIDHRAMWLFQRARTDPAEPVRLDEEPRLVRSVSTPVARDVSVWGEARLSGVLTDAQLDRLVGAPEGIEVTASGSLPGALDQRPPAALDGDPATAHTFPLGGQAGQWIQVEQAEPTTFDAIEVAFRDDEHHSTPRSVRVDVDGVPAAYVPVTPTGPTDAGVTPAVIELPSPVRGSRIRLTVEEVDEAITQDWYTSGALALPVAFAEVSVPGVVGGARPETFDTGCRDDLLSLDGTGVPLRITGDVDDALDRRPLAVVACGEAADGLRLEAGEHVLATGTWATSGLDIDEVVLASARGGAPLPRAEVPLDLPAGPEVEVLGEGRSSFDLEVAPSDAPYWLVLGQSLSPGWQASAAGDDLGEPTLVNGYANGWYVDPAATAAGTSAPLSVRLDWVPQRVVWVALALSAVAAALCLALAVGGRRHRHVPVTDVVGRPAEPVLASPTAPMPAPGRRAAVVSVAVVVVATLLDVPVGPALAMAVPVGVVAWISMRRPAAAGLPLVCATAAVALAAASVVWRQFRYEFPADFIWPQQFEAAHLLTLAAVALVGVQVLRDLLTPGAVPHRSTIALRPDPTNEDPTNEEMT